MLNYSMGLGTAVGLPGVRACARSVLDAEIAEDSTLVAGALEVFVGPVDHPLTFETYSELLGGPVTVKVVLSVDNKANEDDFVRAHKTMLVTAVQLAVQTNAEACLTFQLDRVLMRRISGVVYLYDWHPDCSDPDVGAQLPQPYLMTADAGRLP